ncbi:MAG: hypothetical protein JNK61_08240 [Bacteroidia bacterium]|nr:hypothetical protein [Bacteroidia bacterium]
MKNQFATLTAVLLFTASIIQAQTSWNITGNAATNPMANFIGTTDNKNFNVRTNNQTRLTVDSAGKVGIGTTTPTNLLNIVNNGTAHALRVVSSIPSTANVETQYVGCTNNGSGGAIASRFEAMGASGSNIGVMAYAQSGNSNYGISTTCLTSVGQFGYGIYASATGGGINYAGYFAGNIYGSDRLSIGTTNTGLAKVSFANTDTNLLSMRVYANGANRLVVDGKGNVMIGTNTAAKGYVLSVKGKVMCEELKVALNSSWPDYVFSDTYKLATLEEVEAHIKEHKHLSGIPAANEMEANGLSIGEMQTKLVEKVEELTLYVIQLKKELETVKAGK